MTNIGIKKELTQRVTENTQKTTENKIKKG